MSIRFNDRTNILLDDVKTIADGYKVVRSKIARTGVQPYYGKDFAGEAAKHGFGDNDVVVVYRSPEEVFSKDAVNGWAGVPVTKDHPSVLVTPDNVKEYQVGDVRDKAHIDIENGWLGLEYIIRDRDALANFDSGAYSEVSGGYLATIDWTPGVTPDGKKYDARQVGIVPNHLALVPRGRAFSDSADNWGATPINLSDRKEPQLDMVKLMVGDKAVQVAANDADTITALVKDHAALIADKDKEIGKLTTELATAEAKVLSDEALTKMVDAKVKANTERAAVKARIGDKADTMTDAQIEGAFLALDGTPVLDDTVRKALGDKKQVNDAQAYEARILAAQRKHLNLEAK